MIYEVSRWMVWNMAVLGGFLGRNSASMCSCVRCGSRYVWFRSLLVCRNSSIRDLCNRRHGLSSVQGTGDTKTSTFKCANRAERVTGARVVYAGTSRLGGEEESGRMGEGPC